MHFQSRLHTTAFHELLFAEDCDLNTTSEGEMQRSMDLFATACENFGLIINTEKTRVMHQPPPDTAYVAPQINVDDAQLQVMDNFTYLNNIAASADCLQAEKHVVDAETQQFQHLSHTRARRDGVMLLLVELRLSQEMVHTSVAAQQRSVKYRLLGYRSLKPIDIAASADCLQAAKHVVDAETQQFQHLSHTRARRDGVMLLLVELRLSQEMVHTSVAAQQRYVKHRLLGYRSAEVETLMILDGVPQATGGLAGFRDPAGYLNVDVYDGRVCIS
nr:unnamed protein product [Spirometra erinaceieuropaei]